MNPPDLPPELLLPLLDEERPSPAARRRLRDAVEEAFAVPSVWERFRRFWGRPIPLYQGACAAALVALLLTALREGPPDLHPRAPGLRVDSARPAATNIRVY